MDRGFSAKCFVPWCEHTTTTTHDKVFVKVPSNLRQEWCRKVGLIHKASTHLYCCEDHLNLQEDLHNYYEWKLMQSIPRLKSTAKLNIRMHDREIQRVVHYKRCKPYPPQLKTMMQAKKPVPRPMAKWRRICVIPQTSEQDLTSEQPDSDTLNQPESESTWHPSQVISQLQKMLLKTELPNQFQPKTTTEYTCKPNYVDIKGNRRRIRKNKEASDVGVFQDDASCSSENVSQDAVASQADDEDGSSRAGDEATVAVKEEEQTMGILIKEETEDSPPELPLEEYKALYIKNKKEMTALEFGNQKLAEENQRLRVKNQNLVKLLKKYDENIDTDEEIEYNEINDSQKLKEEKSRLTNEIVALKKQNNIQMRHIQELTEKNTGLFSKIQELCRNNYSLEVKLKNTTKQLNEKNKISIEDDYFASNIEVFTHKRIKDGNTLEKIKETSDGSQGLQENEPLRNEKEELRDSNKETSDKIETNTTIIDKDDEIVNETIKEKNQRELKDEEMIEQIGDGVNETVNRNKLAQRHRITPEDHMQIKTGKRKRVT